VDDTVFINQENVLDGMTFLLAAVILVLFIIIYWSLDNTFGPIMIKKGVPFPAGGAGAAASVASRAGTTSSCSKAWSKTGRQSWSHFFASDWIIPKS
jgi:Cu/Ag efflux pump CusA